MSTYVRVCLELGISGGLTKSCGIICFRFSLDSFRQSEAILPRRSFREESCRTMAVAEAILHSYPFRPICEISRNVACFIWRNLSLIVEQALFCARFHYIDVIHSKARSESHSCIGSRLPETETLPGILMKLA